MISTLFLHHTIFDGPWVFGYRCLKKGQNDCTKLYKDRLLLFVRSTIYSDSWSEYNGLEPRVQ